VAEDFNVRLAGIIQKMKQQQNSSSATLAQQLLRHSTSGIKPFDANLGKGESKQDPSLVSRIFDVLSRPLYGVNELIKEGIESRAEGNTFGERIEDKLGGFISGLTGKEKTLFSDVLEETGMEQGAGRGVLGFAGDVALDPLTWLGGIGLATKSAKVTKEALGAVSGISAKITDDVIQSIAKERPSELAEQFIPRQIDEIASPFARPAERIPSLSEPAIQTQTVPQMLTQEFPRVSVASKLRKLDSATEALRNPTIAIPETLRKLPIAQAAPKLVKSQTQQAKHIKHEKALAHAGVESAETILEQAKLIGGSIVSKAMPKVKLSPERTIRASQLADRYMETNPHREINSVGQMQLYNRIVDDVTKSLAEKGTIKNPRAAKFDKARHGTAFEMLRSAEKQLEASGRVLVDNDGVALRLSEVINELGGPVALKGVDFQHVMEAFAKGDKARLSGKDQALAQAIERVKAARAQGNAAIQSSILSSSGKAVEDITGMTNAARAKEARTSLEGAIGNVVKQAGMVQGDVVASKNLIQKLFQADTSVALKAIDRQAAKLIKQSATGKMNKDTTQYLNDAIYKSLGGRPKILGTVTNGNRATEGIMSKVATWWGAKDLKPFQREHIDTARINAAAFEQAWAPIVRQTTEAERLAGFKSAQGIITPATEKERILSGQFQDAMEKLLHSSRLSDDLAAGNTVALRAGIHMDEINTSLKEMGSKFQFTNTKVKDKYGIDHDFTNNADWLKSWEVGEFTDPMQFMHQINTALQRVTRRNAVMDDMVARWGMPVKTGEFRHTIDDPRMAGFYFPKEIAEQGNVLIKQFEKNFTPNSEMLRTYDKVLRAWKSGVTIYSPSHHIRNIIGDIWLASLDGVSSPKSYMLAMRTMHAMRGRYKDIKSVGELTDPDSLRLAMSRPGDTALTTKGGVPLTFEQLYVAAHNQGILAKASVLEDIITDSGKLIPDMPISQGRVREAAHGLAETRDHFVRIAHFIHVVRNSKTKAYKDLFSEAGHRVKKYHPDGMDLTDFERTVMRRLIPFYSWLRKATPLMVEAMVQKPQLVTMYPKLMANIQDMVGIEQAGGLGDPFPADAQFPDWIRAGGIGPVLHQGMGGLPGFIASLARKDEGREGYVMVNPSNPFNDIVGDTSSPETLIKGSLTPAIQIPMNVWSQETSLGIPIESTPQFLAEQIPVVGTTSRVTGMQQGRRDEPFSPEQLIRLLTASGLQGTAPYEESARQQQLQRLRQRLKEG